MTRLGPSSTITAFFLLFIGLFMLGCGSGRQLQNVTLSPATADAKNFPSGQVSFTTTGTYNHPPSPVQLTSNDIVWCSGGIGTTSSTTGECVGNANPGATVDQKGVAQCNALFVGTATILAGTEVPMVVPMPDSGPQLKIYGSAQLTCP
jgi:hypothetical protein